ncbi:MAG: hypothetical protein C4336_03770, partial [Armatimonadota bacterium]
MWQFLSDLWARHTDSVLKTLGEIVILLIVVLITRWVGGRVVVATLTRKVEVSARRQAQIKTITALLISVLNYVLLFVTVFTVLSIFGVNLGPILATAGVAGLAISFGAQQIVRDVLNGFFI